MPRQFVIGHCEYCSPAAKPRKVTDYCEYLDRDGKPHLIKICKRHLRELRALEDHWFDDNSSADYVEELE